MGPQGAAGLQDLGQGEPPLSGPSPRPGEGSVSPLQPPGSQSHAITALPVHTPCGPQRPHGAPLPPRRAFLEQAALFHQL